MSVPHRERYKHNLQQSTNGCPVKLILARIVGKQGEFFPLFSDFYNNGGGRCALSLETKVDLQRKKVEKMDAVFVTVVMYPIKLAFLVKIFF